MKTKKLFLSAFFVSCFGLIGLIAQVSPSDIIPAGSNVKKLSTDQFKFTEGPVWYADSVLLFTNEGPIVCYDPEVNKFSNWPNQSGGCNGLTSDKAGNLLGCSSKIQMMNKAGQVIKTLASVYNGKRFNGPNDIIADNKGGVYFTDPIFFNPLVQDKTAVYYIDSAGNIKRVIDDLAKPNGILLSPDGKKLYVEDFDSIYVYSWDVASDGSLSGKSRFAELQTTGGVAPGADGMAIDIYGNIYVATLIEKRVQIFSANGTLITTISLPEGPSNCDFGGKDFKTLYITAFTNLYSIDLNYPGFAVSRSAWPVSIGSIPDKKTIEIYPNPVQNVLYIDVPEKTGILEVFDITGKSKLQRVIKENNTSMNVSDLAHGIYYVRILTGKQSFTGKILKN